MRFGPSFLFPKSERDQSSDAPLLTETVFGTQFGLLPREKIELMVRRKMIWGRKEIEPDQYQPASLDLRLGPKAYRVRASFLPGANHTVKSRLDTLVSAGRCDKLKR